MPEIAPFQAIRYDHTRVKGDVSHLIAPPYDVLDESDKNHLLRSSDRNIVTIDLPHLPPKSLGPPAAYEQAAKTMESWLEDGTLVQEREPAIYLYHQRFEHRSRKYTRRKFIARVRLHSFDDGVILPHEKTFGGPKEDRLALMKASKCQLSPVFALYSDPEQEIASAFIPTAGRDPDMRGTLDNVGQALWIVTNEGVINRVVSIMRDKKLYIADGHHRYGTALNYRDQVAQENGGSLPDDHPAQYIMLVLASMDDPGCLILPYFRVIGSMSARNLADTWAEGTETSEADKADLVLYDGSSGKEMPLRFTKRSVLRDLEPGQCAPWYDLDYAYLHRYLIDELLARSSEQPPEVHYIKSADSVRKVAEESSGVALLVKETPLDHLKAVSDAGGLMPQKSTFFYPKLATGFTINPLS